MFRATRLTGAVLGRPQAGLEAREGGDAMKKLLMLTVLCGGLAMVAGTDMAQAHWYGGYGGYGYYPRHYGYGYGHGHYGYRPYYSHYGYHRPYYGGYGYYGGYHRPHYGYYGGYGRSGF
jgi:hypothetical protein